MAKIEDVDFYFRVLYNFCSSRNYISNESNCWWIIFLTSDKLIQILPGIQLCNFTVEVGITGRKVESVCRESSSRIFAPSQYLMASNTESDIRLLEPQILESWKSVFRGWPVFRYSTALRHHIPMFANKSLVDHSINLLDSQKPCIRSTKKELDFFPVFVVKNGEIKNTL